MNSNDSTIPKVRYLIASEWGPLFLGDENSTIRWSLDLSTMELVDAQTRGAHASAQWEPLSSVGRSYLLESIRRNEVEANPASFDIRASAILPDWSASVQAPTPTPKPSGDLLQHLQRRQRSGRGPAA